MFDDSAASQLILYVAPPSMSMSSLSQAGQVTLPTSHVGLGGAGRYSKAEAVCAIGATVIVDCTVVTRRSLVICARLGTWRKAERRQLMVRDGNIVAVTT